MQHIRMQNAKVSRTVNLSLSWERGQLFAAGRSTFLPSSSLSTDVGERTLVKTLTAVKKGQVNAFCGFLGSFAMSTNIILKVKTIRASREQELTHSYGGTKPHRNDVSLVSCKVNARLAWQKRLLNS